MNFLLIFCFLVSIVNLFFFYEDASFIGSFAILTIIPTMIFVCYKKLKTIEAKLDELNNREDENKKEK